MKQIYRLSSILLGIIGLAEMSSAKDKKPHQFELYSWKSGNEWEYALVPAGSNSTKAAVELKNDGGPLHGAGKMKETLLKMKEGDKISWQERADSGLVYPPDLVMDDIKGYAQSVGVKLQAPVAQQEEEKFED